MKSNSVNKTKCPGSKTEQMFEDKMFYREKSASVFDLWTDWRTILYHLSPSHLFLCFNLVLQNDLQFAFFGHLSVNELPWKDILEKYACFNKQSFFVRQHPQPLARLFSSFPAWKNTVSIITAGCKQRINVLMCLLDSLDRRSMTKTPVHRQSLLLVQPLIFLLLVTVNPRTWKVN